MTEFAVDRRQVDLGAFPALFRKVEFELENSDIFQFSLFFSIQVCHYCDLDWDHNFTSISHGKQSFSGWFLNNSAIRIYNFR